MSKDSQDNDPVESIEDEINAIIDSGEEEVIDDQPVDEVEEVNDGSEEQPSEEDDEPSEEAEDDTGSDETTDTEPSEDEEDIQGDATEAGDEPKLEAPEHWAASDREVFNSQTKESQEFLLKRHREMEGAMTRKSQELSSKTRQFDAVEDALSPYRAEFSAAGLDSAGAVRQLASWHDSLKTGGRDAILKLASIYQIDMTEEDQEYIDPALSTIKNELSELKHLTAQQQQAAQREQQSQLERVIDSFVTETDEGGKPKHPHFNALHDDIVKLFNAGMVKDLADAYNKALALRPDLTPAKPEPAPVTKIDQALKVKKAKKAATGIKSSGATKRKRAEMSLEEEIAANL